ncbi:MAG: Endoribonuclease L-PSP [Candidatus Ozemobacter sibiricus]|jgi:2-iminobutanoate/2-iminopropanoate deaminase|uniref:Endoribonuclease L-PSP n=1 Tax=Candidatus Ozemobacter sibiricus TaxID=2268124 RepID=A0A367ZPK9_9BACT|nr:MAG: Endoribonuclease L-PSP [Candidatus Ozemobacter sibiricus]
MSRAVVATQKAPAAIGPYSQAIKANGFVFTSGQIPLSPATGALVAPDIEGQTRQVMENLAEVLKAAGTDFSKVVKTTIFLADMNDFAKVNEIYASYFPKDPPARSTIQVARLPKDAKVEIEMVAIAG